MAASTSSAAVGRIHDHYPDVFINHRGRDVKKTFASHLYYSLVSHGLKAFLDIQEMQEGENLNSQIEQAIATASVHVAILSPHYAESKWCLNELHLMLESGAPIIPVFYHVKPTDLRHVKNGVYAQAFHDLEMKRTQEDQPRYHSSTIKRWRDALSRVADISGLELKAFDGDEGALLHTLIERLQKMLWKKAKLNVAKFPVGMDEKVKHFETTMLLQQHSGKFQAIGITGLGGVGKTTLAKELFNRNLPKCRKSCFLFDVRENAALSLQSLQTKLLKALIQCDIQVNSVDEGKEMLSRYLPSSQVLLVIDDVDTVDQVDALLPVKVREELCPGSLILITSRDRNVLTRSSVNESSIYKLGGLNPQHSRELFCSHAFGRPYPPHGFQYQLVDQFCRACNGLPLSLKVFGACLSGNNDISYWEYQLDKLREILPKEIEKKLKISYDALEPDEQHIFLAVACFFIDEKRDTATRIWDGSRRKGSRGFQSLQDKCLVEVDSENLIKMHDHLRDMGRDIAKHSESRLQLPAGTENINFYLLQQSSIISQVRGVMMVPSGPRASRSEISCLCGILQIPDTKADLLESILKILPSRNLVWLRWYNCPYSSLPDWIPIDNLRVLQMSGRLLKTLWQAERQAPLQLRELQIDAPLSNMPISIGQFKHLEQIYLGRQHNLDILTLPEEFCQLHNLKVLVLMECTKMKSLPDSFGNLTNLQNIDLSECDSLERLPNSFGNLVSLVNLNLKRCRSLIISNEALGNISTLQFIDLSYCEKIAVLPPQVSQQSSLKILNLEGTNLNELPCALGELINLEVLKFGFPLLDTLPDSVGLLSQLTTFKEQDCSSSEPPFKKVRREEETSSNLDASNHRCFPRLQFLSIFNTKISQVSFAGAVCSNLQHFIIDHCNDLFEIGTLPNTLIKLELTSCSNLKKIRGLSSLPNLEELNITWCAEVEELSSIETLASLKKLKVYECAKLKSIDGLARLTNLRLLHVMYCLELEALREVEHCKSLESVTVVECPKLHWAQGMVELLRRLKEYWVDIC